MYVHGVKNGGFEILVCEWESSFLYLIKQEKKIQPFLWKNLICENLILKFYAPNVAHTCKHFNFYFLFFAAAQCWGGPMGARAGLRCVTDRWSNGDTCRISVRNRPTHMPKNKRFNKHVPCGPKTWLPTAAVQCSTETSLLTSAAAADDCSGLYFILFF